MKSLEAKHPDRAAGAGRNRLQTGLTMIGITIGVATVLTMISLGSGAEAAIEDQVRAAGMNLILVTAGNYKTKTQDDAGAVEEQAPVNEQPDLVPAVWTPGRAVACSSRIPSRGRSDGEA